MAYITNKAISGMSLFQLQKAVLKGELTEKRLKAAYTQLRKTAMNRERRVSKPEVVAEFGNTEREYFTKLRNITSTNQLLHEIVDVSRFLKAPKSTLTGLKEQRTKTINSVNSFGFDVDENNYPKFIEFMKWFKSSEYALKFDSGDIAVTDVFNTSETASPQEWQNLFKEFLKYDS